MSVDEGATYDDEDTPSEKAAREALKQVGTLFNNNPPLNRACTPESPLWLGALYINVRDLSEALTETLARGEELKTEEATLKYIRVIRDKLDKIAPAQWEDELNAAASTTQE